MEPECELCEGCDNSSGKSTNVARHTLHAYSLKVNNIFKEYDPEVYIGTDCIETFIERL